MKGVRWYRGKYKLINNSSFFDQFNIIVVLGVSISVYNYDAFNLFIVRGLRGFIDYWPVSRGGLFLSTFQKHNR